MVEIKASIIINSTQEKIWNVISDMDNEPKFWKGTKEIRNISKDGNQVSREITIAFRDQKCLQEVTIVPKEMIKAVITAPPVRNVRYLKTLSIGNWSAIG